MYTILKVKGYSGNQDIISVINWLATKNIHVDLFTVWKNESSDEIIGKRAQAHIKPYTTPIITPNMQSYDAALEVLIFNIIDYI